jgi:hypothetical protein
MQNFVQLGVRYAKRPADDRRHASNGGVVQRKAKSVATDHSTTTHNY